ncbi:helix-turn-helix transcriptional regulator [Mycolicibacterium brisbanense]|uniref:LuxR family transcriptional regulator n=1 Tax=Mycolicibacterium brisbanense TaxID=146020 RepID=A0A100W597_9MYCO|nr:LuxR C-terminal-related transcriptional regulator [Mycolicibacterium brisbanense]MCV7155995.1 AAA family ATPase [Mycolicibacterium brisbanense]GAS91844.1 LuxR family transcriptional regulator [Mycolicibacterium brisbanense]
MPAGSSGFVGRDGDLADLSARLAATATRGAAVVALLGRPGIGKTALLRELAARHEGARWAGAAAWESDLPGGVLAQLLQDDFPDDPVDAAAHLVDLLRGPEPTLLLIDDVEHSDSLSLQAISTLVRHQRELPVLVVVATCAGIPPEPIADLAADRIRLHGLSRHAVAELAAERGHALHPAMAQLLTEHTAGSPRDVLALLDELPGSIWARPDASLPAPAHVTAEVADMLSRCGPEARALVDALAVLETVRDAGVALSEASELAGLTDPRGAIDDAARLLDRVSPLEPRLRDPMTRAALLDIMGVRAAGAAHRHAADIVGDPVARLQHLVAATPTLDAELAADVDRLARERGAEGSWASAAALFRDASRLTPDPLLREQRLTLAVDALVAAGDCGAAAALVPAVESLRETPLRNAVLAYLAILRGRATEAEVRLRRAWDIVNVDRDPETAALIAQRYVLHTLVRCRGDEVVDWADTALQLANPDSPAGIESAAVRGLGLAAAGHPREATAAYDEVAARLPHGAQAQRVTMGRGWLQFIRDDVETARSNLESAVATAALGGSTRITLWALGWLARVQFVCGDWDEALASVESGRALAQTSGITIVTPLLEWTATQIQALRGNWTAAEASLRAADAVTQDYEMMKIPVLLARAYVAEADADYAKVRRVLEPLAAMAAGTSLTEPGYWPWPDMLANAMVLGGDLDAADEFLRPHERRAAERGHRSAMARLGYARGRLLGARGDLPAARAAFERALELLDGLPLRYDTARVNFAYGQTLRRAGKRREADAVISTARDIYLALGAQTYVTRCERELKAGGLHLMRGSRDSVELTPQEDAVSSLVAQGLSNREVAAELYVSPKTVQYHLTRIYAKLGVRSRAELVALRR